MGTLREGKYYVIAVAGTSVHRASAIADLRALGTIMHVPVDRIPLDEGQRYFNVPQQSLKTTVEDVKV